MKALIKLAVLAPITGIALGLMLVIALCTLSTCAYGQTVVGVHLVSHHIPTRSDQNNLNLGAYVRTENGITLGAYRNTLSRTSVYAGLTLERGPFALTAGAVTGYRKDDRGRGFSKSALTPMLAPSVRWGSARLSFIPGVGVSPSVLHLSLEAEI